MPESYSALCADYYVNQKLNVKLELPSERQTVLDMLDRVRRRYPDMDQMRRFKEELALETPGDAAEQKWLAIRNTSVRSGFVNPDSLDDAYRLHREILEVCPFYLGVPPIDVEYVELLYGFDLAAAGNHDEIVFRALVAGSPLASVLDIPGTVPIDCQPMFGVSLREPGEIEAHFEVKTRVPQRKGRLREEDGSQEPISVYLTLRKYGPIGAIEDLPKALESLCDRGEELVESRVVPNLVTPIRDAIGLGH
jgi:hypothetical protein